MAEGAFHDLLQKRLLAVGQAVGWRLLAGANRLGLLGRTEEAGRADHHPSSACLRRRIEVHSALPRKMAVKRAGERWRRVPNGTILHTTSQHCCTHRAQLYHPQNAC